MKKRKLFALLLLCNFFLVSSFAQPGRIGDYKVASVPVGIASTASEAAWYKAAAEAIALAYAAGYVIGTIAHHAWDRFVMESAIAQEDTLFGYNNLDFSKFDN